MNIHETVGQSANEMQEMDENQMITNGLESVKSCSTSEFQIEVAQATQTPKSKHSNNVEAEAVLSKYLMYFKRVEIIQPARFVLTPTLEHERTQKVVCMHALNHKKVMAVHKIYELS